MLVTTVRVEGLTAPQPRGLWSPPQTGSAQPSQQRHAGNTRGRTAVGKQRLADVADRFVKLVVTTSPEHLAATWVLFSRTGTGSVQTVEGRSVFQTPFYAQI